MKNKGYKMPNIETLGFNYPSERANGNYTKTEGAYQMIDYMVKNYPNVNYIKLHTGLVFNIGEVKLEVLGSVENMINANGKIDSSYDANDTSMLVRYSFGGISFLMTSDMGTHTSMTKKHIDMYSQSFFKSDVLQAAHHGYNRIYDLYRYADCEYNLVSNAEENIRSDVYGVFNDMFEKDKILYAGNYTYGIRSDNGKIVVEKYLRYDNPEYNK